MNPINAIGVITLHKGGKEIFLGTAFCYKSPRFLLTASHVFPDDFTNVISITFPYLEKVLIPTKIAKHDSADIIAFACEENHVSNKDVVSIEYFSSLHKEPALISEFISFGFPEDLFSRSGTTPTPRAFKGYFQRCFFHESSFGYKYDAIELNITCPKGLSGAPIMMHNNTSSIAGIVTENIETATELYTEENLDNKVVTYMKVINYGVGVYLYPLSEWIEEHLGELNT